MYKNARIVTFQCPVPGWSVSFFADSFCIPIIRNICGMFQEIPYTESVSHNSVIFRKRGSVWDCTFNTTILPSAKEDQLPFYVYECLEVMTDNMPAGQLLFHGGAVCRDGYAWGLFAPTRTGKSTLVTALCINRYEYLSDDYLFLNPDDYTVYAYPKPIMLRDISFFTNDLNPYILAQGENRIRHEQDTLLVGMSVPKASPSLKGFIILNRTENSLPGLTPLGSTRTFLELLRNTKRPCDLECVRNHSYNLSQSIKAYIMTYETIEQAIQLLEQLFN